MEKAHAMIIAERDSLCERKRARKRDDDATVRQKCRLFSLSSWFWGRKRRTKVGCERISSVSREKIEMID